jgi:hypothetical protein
MASFGKIARSIAGTYSTSAPSITSHGSGANFDSNSTFVKSETGNAFLVRAADPFNRGATKFQLASGQLPPGYFLNENTGAVSGSFDGILKHSRGTVDNSLTFINAPQRVFSFSITASDGHPAMDKSNTVTQNFTITINVPFKFRQVVTRNYMIGGYQNSTLWNNVNRCLHSTDTTTNLGDGLIQNMHYKSGACSTSKCFIWNGGFVTAFNMRTESRSDSGSINFSGSNTGTIWDSEFKYAWINGEGCNQVRRWSIATESVQSDRGGGWSSHAASIVGENRGTWWNNDGYTTYFVYATETEAGNPTSAGAHGQQKGLSSKNGRGYGGNEGSYNGGYNWRVTNDTNGARISIVAKFHANMGEENYGHGQDKGYCLGQYDGAQNNRSGILFYATDSGYETGSSTQPKGKGGCSSGHCGFVD